MGCLFFKYLADGLTLFEALLCKKNFSLLVLRDLCKYLNPLIQHFFLSLFGLVRYFNKYLPKMDACVICKLAIVFSEWT